MFGTALAVFSFSANAANFSACGPFEALDKTLQKAGEAPILAWIESDGSYRFFYGGKAGAWTLVATVPGGLFCTMRDGKGFDILIK